MSTLQLAESATILASADAEFSSKLGAIDQLISDDRPFRFDADALRSVRDQIVREAVEVWLRSKTPFATYARLAPVILGTLPTGELLDQLPLLPCALFKREGLMEPRPGSSNVIWTTSSGTKGSVSRIPRDDRTLRRFFAGIGCLSADLLDVETSDILLMNLGPDSEEAHHLWISYVMAGMNVMLPTSKYYVKGGTFLLEQAIRDIAGAVNVRIALVGPPHMILAVTQAMTARGTRPKVAQDSIVMSIGGWKRHTSEQITKVQFREAASSALGIQPSQIRDAFNMVELNTVVIECEEHRMHIPPWLYMRAKDARSLKTLQSGRSGVLSFLDATAASYPAFILCDDVGTVQEEYVCPCGRVSDVLTIQRRLNTLESRGCALKMNYA